MGLVHIVYITSTYTHFLSSPNRVKTWSLVLQSSHDSLLTSSLHLCTPTLPMSKEPIIQEYQHDSFCVSCNDNTVVEKVQCIHSAKERQQQRLCVPIHTVYMPKFPGHAGLPILMLAICPMTVYCWSPHYLAKQACSHPSRLYKSPSKGKKHLSAKQ